MFALSRLDPRSLQVLHHAQEETKRLSQEFINPEQLLLGLFYDGDVFRILEQFNVDVAKLTHEIQAKERPGTFSGQPTMGPSVVKIFDEAYSNAKKRGASFVSPEDIMVALFSETSTSEFLKTFGVQRDKLEEKLSKSTGYVSSSRKSVLEKYGIDLTQEAKDGKLDPIAGRERETERLIHILLRRTKNNPIIIGEAGVGKTAIVESLALKIAEGSVPHDLLNKRIIQLELASLVAGASHRGEFEERLQDVIKETQASNGQVILFIDEIHTLIGTGDTQGAMDASNIIKPYLARGQLQLIGTTTTAEYRKYFEKDKAFERRFQAVLVDEPTEEVAEQMLEVLKPKYEKFHSVEITPEAIKAAVHLSKKYIGERYLPDKAVDLLDEAAAEVKLQHTEGKRQDNKVIKSDIEKVVSAWTGIPITRLTEDESQKLIHLEDIIHKRLIDQEEAVAAVSEAVRRGRIGLASANRPIASFIFLGPTGVGKTELAKTLAEILFGRDDLMIRLDMSEYMEKHEVAKLIGAPPGYVGYEEGGQLTEAVRAKPYSIVLLDEIEKAHPDVFNILLQLLEDGRLTDNKGNTISFKNTIIIATSNIGSSLIQQTLLTQSSNATQVVSPAEEAKRFSSLSKTLMDELRKFFKPELLNRFDEIVMFKPLRQQDMMQIAKIGISKTQKLLAEQEINLTITEKALGVLSKEGYDPVYGARPLRRLIQSAIENPIAILLINKTFTVHDTVQIDYDDAKAQFTFTKLTQPVDKQEQQPIPASSAQVATQQSNMAAAGSVEAANGNGILSDIAKEHSAAIPPPVQSAPPMSSVDSSGTIMQPA
ncbi:MAG: ATP-dependent Clp protease ATP-binding subunit [Candidatus Levybacteria bacterium]|nr:ATP-dependent Clp protease ATP-binding subunit [Candidatus Levybacteria bacterium]MBP9814793.1 ATP-dependent Clp protease ATP-binding subunit [Candidatus Levybacteria bacterium]